MTPVIGPTRLGPAVTFDIHTTRPDHDDEAPEGHDRHAAQATQREARIRIDQDTKSIVYQEVDPSSGDIVIQLPDPVVLKARAYADRAAAAASEAAAEDHPVDRKA
ncbi:hypothetical protein [Methylobacterium gossipiicola]|uniref:hypothetical protein n=1 Tax=Methylobacterium gossipiicola TaxID=582675 RepID=UPI001160DAB3|nr:hypothetical protein [Methylobacterium gossipiicola]